MRQEVVTTAFNFNCISKVSIGGFCAREFEEFNFKTTQNFFYDLLTIYSQNLLSFRLFTEKLLRPWLKSACTLKADVIRRVRSTVSRSEVLHTSSLCGTRTAIIELTTDGPLRRTTSSCLVNCLLL
jgi:hypothetical protein